MLNMLPGSRLYYDNDLFGAIITPNAGIPSKIKTSKVKFIVDNGMFTGNFNPKKFITLLNKLVNYNENCLGVVAPDCVGDWIGTLKRYRLWHKSIKNLGFKVFIAIQDGANLDNIPFANVDGLFIAGTTKFKLSSTVIDIIDFARANSNLWIHIARINSIKRMRRFWYLADSFDGTGIIYYPDRYIKLFLPHMRSLENQTKLNL